MRCSGSWGSWTSWLLHLRGGLEGAAPQPRSSYALAAQPGLEVLHSDADARTEPPLGDLALGHGEQIPGAHVHFRAQHRELIGPAHHGIEGLAGNGGEPRMRNPGAVVPGPRLAQLVGAHARHGRLVRRRVVAD